jgi:hypothetical protein
MKNEMKQTVVEWLVEKLDQNFDYVADTIIQQAKEMEKQQIIDAGNDNIFCDAYTIDEEDNYKLTTKGELYYNDTFNN